MSSSNRAAELQRIIGKSHARKKRERLYLPRLVDELIAIADTRPPQVEASENETDPRELHASAKRATTLSMPAAEVTLEAAEGESKGPRKFDVLAYTGGPLSVDNFDLPVVVDLSTLKVGNSLVANLDHVREKRVGNITEVANDGKSVRVKGAASAATAHRDEVVNSADAGFKWQASIETAQMKLRKIAPGKTVQVNGQEITGPVYVTTAATLKGMAFVTHGADDGSEVSIAAAAAKDKNVNPEFEKWLKAKNWDPAELDADQLKTLNAAWKKETKQTVVDDDSEPETLDAIVAREKKNQDRERKITELAAAAIKKHPRHLETIETLSRTAIENGDSVRDAELAILRATQTSVGIIRTGSGERPNNLVLEAALCMSGGVRKPDDYFDEEVLDAANRQFRRGLSIQELLLLAAAENGYRGRVSIRSNLEEVLEYAFPARGQRQLHAAGGFSSISLPTVLSNAQNKINIDSFNAVEAEWRKFCAFRSVNDFKEISGFSLTGDLTYEKVGPTGKIRSGDLKETTYGNKADTYAKMLTLPREHIINDDQGAFNAIGKRLGRGGALKMNLVFWVEFLDNLSFFTSGRGNFDDGADSAFDEAGLAAADVLFRALLDPDNNPLGAIAKFLLVPSPLRIAARKLMNSTTVAKADNSGTDNPWAGQYEVVSSQYMTAASISGSSAKKWYLLADPNDIAVMEGVFLDGQQLPNIESAMANFDVLGISWRATHDFGFRKQEWRGGVAMKGEA